MTACARKGKISSRARKKLPARAFALPSQRKYPLYKQSGGKLVPSATHARNAKARASAQARKGNLSATQKRTIDRKAVSVSMKEGTYRGIPLRLVKVRTPKATEWSWGFTAPLQAAVAGRKTFPVTSGPRTYKTEAAAKKAAKREVDKWLERNSPKAVKARVKAKASAARARKNFCCNPTAKGSSGTYKGWRWRTIRTNVGWRGQILAATPSACVVVGRSAKTKAQAAKAAKRWIDRQRTAPPDVRGCRWPTGGGNLLAGRGVKRNPRRGLKKKKTGARKRVPKLETLRPEISANLKMAYLKEGGAWIGGHDKGLVEQGFIRKDAKGLLSGIGGRYTITAAGKREIEAATKRARAAYDRRARSNPTRLRALTRI